MAIKNLFVTLNAGLFGGTVYGPVGYTIITADTATSLAGLTTITKGNEQLVEGGKHGSLITSVGTSVITAGNGICDKAFDYYNTEAYIESLDEEQVATALNDLGISIEEEKTLTKHI